MTMGNGVGRFEGASVVVTGAAQGMGRAVATAMVREGATVFAADVNAQRLSTTAAELGDAVAPVGCDVRKAGDVDALFAAADERCGGVDHLITCAGVLTIGKCVDLKEDDWSWVMDVNAKGVFLCMRRALISMRSRRAPSIVNVASQAGKRGTPLLAHYCASKAAVILLSKTVALEAAPHVRVNCICPGVVTTEMLDREFEWTTQTTGESREAIEERWRAIVPLRRFQTPEQIARVVLYLASDDASEITGQAINVDGGLVTEV
jgi:meso-butanediol dehydrogenase/(S,S)-butanediol dehydrogenase/diacetyl reductase